jgi:N-acetylneuraminate synthase
MNVHHPTQLKPLFIFEMANNHGGSFEHGLAIIRGMNEVAEPFREEFDFGFKLQYRDLDTFIHPEFKGRHDFKYVKRFLETRLELADLKRLKDEMKRLGFITLCTPYDEKSVDRIEEHGFDRIKIASASLTDWPLLERIVKTSHPLIASTGGVTLRELDNVVSFFEHRNKNLTLLHCVSLYPTPEDRLELNQIDLLRTRYPGLKIGYSTHESPDHFDPVKLAVAKGAVVFEKHVGIATAPGSLNDYSAGPEQVGRWLQAAREAFAVCGTANLRPGGCEQEQKNLRSLRRGVFAKRPISAGEKITADHIFLAIPTAGDQVTANDLSKYTRLQATADIGENQPVLFSNSSRVELREKIWAVVQQIKAFLKQSHIPVSPQLDLEISYHYGIDKFRECGAAIITYVNREYCRKLIIVLPGQRHPEQHHRMKEETFVILYGDVQAVINGAERDCRLGDVVTIEKGARHAFKSQSGAVIEEISTTHYRDDSYYTDPAITENPDRKTTLTFWLD